jgi:hypothetical protein
MPTTPMLRTVTVLMAGLFAFLLGPLSYAGEAIPIVRLPALCPNELEAANRAIVPWNLTCTKEEDGHMVEVLYSGRATSRRYQYSFARALSLLPSSYEDLVAIEDAYASDESKLVIVSMAIGKVITIDRANIAAMTHNKINGLAFDHFYLEPLAWTTAGQLVFHATGHDSGSSKVIDVVAILSVQKGKVTILLS